MSKHFYRDNIIYKMRHFIVCDVDLYLSCLPLYLVLFIPGIIAFVLLKVYHFSFNYHYVKWFTYCAFVCLTFYIPHKTFFMAGIDNIKPWFLIPISLSIVLAFYTYWIFCC